MGSMNCECQRQHPRPNPAAHHVGGCPNEGSLRIRVDGKGFSDSEEPRYAWMCGPCAELYQSNTKEFEKSIQAAMDRYKAAQESK